MIGKRVFLWLLLVGSCAAALLAVLLLLPASRNRRSSHPTAVSERRAGEAPTVRSGTSGERLEPKARGRVPSRSHAPELESRTPSTRAVPSARRPVAAPRRRATPTADRAALRVTVVDARGAPIPDVAVGEARAPVSNGPGQVTVYSMPAIQKRTDPAGQVEFPDLEAGHRILVRATLNGLTHEESARPRAGRSTEVTVRFSDGVEMSGTVRHVERGPLSGANVCLTRVVRSSAWRCETAIARTDGLGGFKLPYVPPGTYVCAIFYSDPHDRVARTAPFQVPEAGPWIHDFVVGRTSLVGSIRDAATAMSVAGVQVSVQGAGTAFAESDEEGTFRFLDLPPGSYKVSCIKDGYTISTTKATVGEGVPERIEIDLEPAPILRLILADPDGNPLPGDFSVSLSRSSPVQTTRSESTPRSASNMIFVSRSVSRGPNLGVSMLRADDHGRLVIAMVPPGTYDVSVAGNGLRGERREIRIQPGENETHLILKRNPPR